MFDTKALAETLLQTVREWAEPAFKALGARIKELEQRAPVPGQKGDPGERGIDGKDGAAGRDGIDGKEGGAGKDGRDGVDGKDGQPGERGDKGEDGKSFTTEEVQAMVDAAVKRAIDAQPPAKDGAAGRDGKDGADGKSVTAEELHALAVDLFAKALPGSSRRSTSSLSRFLARRTARTARRAQA
jgi:hypothetical protein